MSTQDSSGSHGGQYVAKGAILHVDHRHDCGGTRERIFPEANGHDTHEAHEKVLANLAIDVPRPYHHCAQAWAIRFSNEDLSIGFCRQIPIEGLGLGLGLGFRG